MGAAENRLKSLRDQAEQREAQAAATRQERLKREFYERQGSVFDWQIPGHDLTCNELRMEDLDERPSRVPSSHVSVSRRVPSSNTGPDRSSAPNARPAGRTDSFPRPAGQTFKETE